VRTKVKTVKKLKDKLCRNCLRYFSPVRPLQVCCSLNCAIELAKVKAELKEKKDWNKRKKEGLEKLKTVTVYEKDARKVFQMWIRLRDVGLPCISCGAGSASQWDGGHYFKAELYSGLIFNEDNCSKQCSRCNNELHGNESNYRIGLVKKIGEERVRWLEENKDRLRTVKFSKEELIEIKKKYLLKVKEIKQKLKGL
jgi:hypothetical protein